jgi:hypothetical protein
MKTLPLMVLFGLAGLAGRAVARRHASRFGGGRRIPDRACLEEPAVHHEQLETYQDLLDESLHLTFPASDPICAQAATRCAEPCETPGNRSDWHLHPGSGERAAPAA